MDDYSTCPAQAPDLLALSCFGSPNHSGPHWVDYTHLGFSPGRREWEIRDGRRVWLGDMAASPALVWPDRASLLPRLEESNA